ncbi:SWIM zinc finger family protein, partial [Streptomyces sp. UH6]|nr:SWIM zinc finger family protein [Streptomyces sp. UH6]
MTRSLQAVAYTRPSALESTAEGRLLGLETSRGATPTGVQDHPSFFSGFLTHPQAAAAGLLAVADVAAARYNRPQLAASLDPVVTGNGDRLRFESFSGCCGVYARLDVLSGGLDGGDVGHGTTNVDVNNPLREALSRVGTLDPVHLRVGPDELAVTTTDGPVVEKKVPLPDRWLRGFAESQVVSAGFELRAELPAAEAVRFLRSLPRGGGRGGASWVVPAGRGLRPTTRPVPGAVCLPGPERLAALQRVLRHATALRVYGPGVSGTG